MPVEVGLPRSGLPDLGADAPGVFAFLLRSFFEHVQS